MGSIKGKKIFGKLARINEAYELNYWSKKSKKEVMNTYLKAVDILRVDEYLHGTVVELGCGPLNGIFAIKQFPKMIAIDPLWKMYEEQFGTTDENVIKIVGNGNCFNWIGKADSIISINALDHSGHLVSAGKEISSHLKPGGFFVLHVHLREVREFNAGHPLSISEDLIARAFSELKPIWEKVESECPLYGGKYKTYMGCWQKEADLEA